MPPFLRLPPIFRLPPIYGPPILPIAPLRALTLTVVRARTLGAEPLHCDRLVLEAADFQSALTRQKFDVLMGHLEVPGIAHQGDPALRRGRELLNGLEEPVSGNLKDRRRQADQNQDARSPVLHLLAHCGEKESVRLFYGLPAG